MRLPALVCVYVRMYVCTCVCVRAFCERKCVRVCAFVHMRVCTCEYIRTYVHVDVHVDVHA